MIDNFRAISKEKILYSKFLFILINPLGYFFPPLSVLAKMGKNWVPKFT